MREMTAERKKYIGSDAADVMASKVRRVEPNPLAFTEVRILGESRKIFETVVKIISKYIC